MSIIPLETISTETDLLKFIDGLFPGAHLDEYGFVYFLRFEGSTLCSACLERTYGKEDIVVESIVVRSKLCGKKKIRKLGKFKDYVLSKLNNHVEKKAAKVEVEVLKLKRLQTLQESMS